MSKQETQNQKWQRELCGCLKWTYKEVMSSEEGADWGWDRVSDSVHRSWSSEWYSLLYLQYLLIAMTFSLEWWPSVDKVLSFCLWMWCAAHCPQERLSESFSSLGWWHLNSGSWSRLQVQPETLELKETAEEPPGEWGPVTFLLLIVL
jgi:hypothetical protein